MIEVWMHKETGEIVLAAKLWSQGYVPYIDREGFCSYFQVLGYGIENKNDVMVVMPESVKDYFEVIGEW